MEQKTLHLKDAFTNDDAVIIVRNVERNVAVALSLGTNGDVEIFFKPDDLNRFILALQDFADVLE